jgi:hypothetical protein
MNSFTISQLQKIDDKTLYEYCQYVGKQARIWKNHFVALLPEVAKRGLHKTHGFATIVEFAAQVGGVGKKTVEAIFQVEKLLNDKPILKDLIPVVGVNKVRIVATIATKENQNILAEKVKEMSKSALKVWTREVKNMRENGLLNEKLENTQDKGKQVLAENDLASNLGQQNLLDIENNPTSGQFPPGRSNREHFNFGLDENVSFKLRLFKQKLEKAKKISLEWNDVIDELLKKADI